MSLPAARSLRVAVVPLLAGLLAVVPLTAQAAISPREAARSATGLPFEIEIEDQISEAVPVRPEVVEVEATVVEPGEIAAALTEESPTDLPPRPRWRTGPACAV